MNLLKLTLLTSTAVFVNYGHTILTPWMIVPTEQSSDNVFILKEVLLDLETGSKLWKLPYTIERELSLTPEINFEILSDALQQVSTYSSWKFDLEPNLNSISFFQGYLTKDCIFKDQTLLYPKKRSAVNVAQLAYLDFIILSNTIKTSGQANQTKKVPIQISPLTKLAWKDFNCAESIIIDERYANVTEINLTNSSIKDLAIQAPLLKLKKIDLWNTGSLESLVIKQECPMLEEIGFGYSPIKHLEIQAPLLNLKLASIIHLDAIRDLYSKGYSITDGLNKINGILGVSYNKIREFLLIAYNNEFVFIDLKNPVTIKYPINDLFLINNKFIVEYDKDTVTILGSHHKYIYNRNTREILSKDISLFKNDNKNQNTEKKKSQPDIIIQTQN